MKLHKKMHSTENIFSPKNKNSSSTAAINIDTINLTIMNYLSSFLKKNQTREISNGKNITATQNLLGKKLKSFTKLGIEKNPAGEKSYLKLENRDLSSRDKNMQSSNKKLILTRDFEKPYHQKSRPMLNSQIGNKNAQNGKTNLFKFNKYFENSIKKNLNDNSLSCTQECVSISQSSSAIKFGMKPRNLMKSLSSFIKKGVENTNFRSDSQQKFEQDSLNNTYYTKGNGRTSACLKKKHVNNAFTIKFGTNPAQNEAKIAHNTNKRHLDTSEIKKTLFIEQTSIKSQNYFLPNSLKKHPISIQNHQNSETFTNNSQVMNDSHTILQSKYGICNHKNPRQQTPKKILVTKKFENTYNRRLNSTSNEQRKIEPPENCRKMNDFMYIKKNRKTSYDLGKNKALTHDIFYITEINKNWYGHPMRNSSKLKSRTELTKSTVIQN